MKEVIKLYRLFNLLSLDVVTGAVISSLFFSKIFEVAPSYPSFISLGLTVWIIYTADRLLDIRDVKGEAASERHRFHQRNETKLKYWLVVVLIIDIVLIFFMPVKIIKDGIFLSLVVVIYILLRRKLHISKELLVAALYTAGVVLPSWPENQMRSTQYLIIFMFFLIALINLIVFSWYEKENDLLDRQASVATLVEETKIRYILTGLFVITFSISFYLFFQSPYRFISWVLIAMAAILLLIFTCKRFFARSDYYRLAGDAVFLFPIVYILQ
jgi:4-hydroxybenzoate polyprenyltransferase